MERRHPSSVLRRELARDHVFVALIALEWKACQCGVYVRRSVRGRRPRLGNDRAVPESRRQIATLLLSALCFPRELPRPLLDWLRLLSRLAYGCRCARRLHGVVGQVQLNWLD